MGKIDTMTKQYISSNDRFADICNFYLFNGEKVITPDALVERDATELSVVFSEEKVLPLQKIRDILKKAVLKSADGVMYMIVGIENQSDVHYAMSVKNMLYDALNYAGQVQRIAAQHKIDRDLKNAEFLSGFAKTDKLTPVVTITLYWKAGTWDGPRTLHEMLNVNNVNILEYVQDYKLNLIVPDEIKDFNKFNTELKKMMEFISCSNDADKIIRFSEMYRDDRLISQEGARLLNECFDANIKIPQEKGAKADMCKGIEDYGLIKKAEGVREGMCEGMRKGMREGKLQILLDLVMGGDLSIEIAAQKAQMSTEEFCKLLVVNGN